MTLHTRTEGITRDRRSNVRRHTSSAGFLALVLAVAFCQFTPGLHAQNQTQDRSSPQQQQGQQQPDEQKGETFVGQVVKAKNGQYALLAGKQAGKGYYLDDQERAKQYDGQNVKVTGTLDVATSTIHVTDIQPA
jgi:hypothetical protein